jgi:hypothetical protein
MILLVCGGREYTMTPYDWLRLDAFHFRSTLPAIVLQKVWDLTAQLGDEFVPAELERVRQYPGPVTAVYEGEATGADTCARAWAESRDIPVRPFSADWSKGKSAGPKRNAVMLAAAVCEAVATGQVLLVVGFPGNDGTADMLAQARAEREIQAAGLIRIADYRGDLVQRWTAEDVQAAEMLAEGHSAGGEPDGYAWPMGIAERWIQRGAAGVPLCSAHLWTDHGRVHLPPAGALYIGRHDQRNGIPESLLANPFRKTDGVDVAVLLDRYRSHLRAAYQRNTAVRQQIHQIRPWTLLICWCHADRPCHGTVVADAAMQAQAAAELHQAGRSRPAKHWSAYRPPRTQERPCPPTPP